MVLFPLCQHVNFDTLGSLFLAHTHSEAFLCTTYTPLERERDLDNREGMKFIFLNPSFLIRNVNYNNNPNLSETCALNRNIQGSFANWRLNSDASFKNLLCVCVWQLLMQFLTYFIRHYLVWLTANGLGWTADCFLTQPLAVLSVAE